MATKPLYSASQMPDDAKKLLYDKITEWHELNEKLTPMVDREKQLRTELYETYFKISSKLKEGTNHIDIGFGKFLTAQLRINRKIDEAQLEAALVAQVITQADIDSIISFKPTLRVGDWKDADLDFRRKFGDIVTEEPGLPGLSISSPKR